MRFYSGLTPPSLATGYTRADHARTRVIAVICWCFFFSSRRRHTRCLSDWSSDVCSSDLLPRLENETHDRTRMAVSPTVAAGSRLKSAEIAAGLTHSSTILFSSYGSSEFFYHTGSADRGIAGPRLITAEMA